MRKLYRLVGEADGWMYSDPESNDMSKLTAEDWRLATRREWVWYALFRERFSFFEYVSIWAAILIAYTIAPHDLWVIAIASFATGFASRWIKAVTKPKVSLKGVYGDDAQAYLDSERDSWDEPTPDKVEAVKSTFEDKMAAALEQYPAREPVTDLSPLTGHEAPCPRCGSHATTIDFMAGAHEHCPDARMATAVDLFGGIFDVNYGILALNQRINEAAVPHHDRSCHNCGFKWVEGTL